MKIRYWVYIIILFSISWLSFPQNKNEYDTLNKAVSLIALKNYDEAIGILRSITSTNEEIIRKVNYYLSECYFLKKDFSNAFYFGEKVLKDKSYDFYYQKSLYDVIVSSYMMNDFSKSINYSKEYLDKFGDSWGLEENVFIILVNSLQAIGRIDEAVSFLEKYKDKYPGLYSSVKPTIANREVKYESKNGSIQNSQISESELREIINSIKKNLEEISKRRDRELEKMEGIIELLSMKEELLKLKKYKMISE
jgi:hypothetical protein